MSKASKRLFTLINTPPENVHAIIPHINRFLEIHPYAGKYEVDDRQHVSSASNRRNLKWHPSSDCMKCERLLYYERDEAAPPMDRYFEPRLRAIFKEGAAIHAMIQAWFVAMNELDGFPKLIGNEVRIDDGNLNISGYIDSVVCFGAERPSNESSTILEIKTINDYQFQQLKAPKPEHKMQVGAYMAATGIPESIVLYYNKNTSDMKEFLVKPFDMQNVFMRWQNVQVALDAGSPEMLQRACKCGSKQWKECPARDICFNESRKNV